MGKNYSNQDLRGANFANQNLIGANFRGANLEGANFSNANLRGARFDSMRDKAATKSPVSVGQFQTRWNSPEKKPGISNDAKPGLTNLRGANLWGAQLHSANFARADLTGADLTEAKAGLQRRWWILQIIFALVLSGVFSFVGLFFSAFFTVYFFSPEIIKAYGLWLGIPFVALQIGMMLAIAIQGAHSNLKCNR